jgi:hypothetical protein
MWDKLVAWYQKHTEVTHALAVAIAFLVGAYFQVPAFHNLVTTYYGMLPQSVKEVVATAIALYGFYRNGYKPGN